MRLVTALDTIYMDGPAYCDGRTIPVGEESRVVEPRGTGMSNPRTQCVVHFESTYQESSYRFQIVVESAQFRDCALELKIFDGPNVGGNYIRQLGCGSASTGQFYSKDRSITLQLKRSVSTYVFGSHFRLRIKTYKAADAGEEYLGTYRFSAGAIIGIILGIVVLVALAILLGWCYKTGRLPGYSRDEYPPNYKNGNFDNVSKSDKGGSEHNFVSWNMKEVDKTSTTDLSRSNFDLDNPDMWASLTGPPGEKKAEKKERTRNLGTDSSSGRSYGNNYFKTDNQRAQYDKNSTAKYYENFDRTDPNQLSHSPGSRVRRNNNNSKANNAQKETTFDAGGQGLKRTGQSERNYENITNQKSKQNGLKKRTGSGLFENPDSEGYLYDYEQVQALSDENPQTEKKKTQDFETELKQAIRRNSMKRQQSGSGSEPPGAPGSSEAELNKINFSDDNVSIPRYNVDSDLSSSNPGLGKGEDTGPDAESSPKPKKKKRKSSKERQKSPKSKRKGAQQNEDRDNITPKSDETEPPEIYAPIFSGEDNSDPASVPNMYQPGYQGNYPPAPYYGDPRYPMPAHPGYPPGVPGMPPTGPFQQAGQAQWYVQGGPDGQQKMAFAMTTHSQGSHDDKMGHPGMPNSSSTPYYQNQYGAPQRYNKYPNMESGPGGPGNSLVPAGTVLDDPQVPPPGTSIVRYDDDPSTGVKTSQVIWTDSKPDPTDPPPDSNPQITRKTITRVTTKATTDELPDAPNPSLHDMSYRTAQQIQASGAEPAFMSPSRGAPALPYPTHSIQYASETPERTNASFYTAPHGNKHIPGAPGPVIHEAPDRNEAIRDRIVMSTAED